MAQALTTLDLSNNQLAPEGAEPLINALKDNQVRATIDRPTIAALFSSAQTLTSLDLSNNLLAAEGVQSLANVL